MSRLSQGALIFIICLICQAAQGQSALFHATAEQRKVLVIERLSTGVKDTVYSGSYVKLWMHSDKGLRKMQPLTKMDLNTHTVYYESVILAVTDSSLLLLRKMPLPLPLPLPFLKPKTLFDTIPIKNITAFRTFNKEVEMSVTNAVTMPAMSFMPSDLLQFPYMFVMMPVMQSVTQVSSSIMSPTRRIRSDKGELYRFFVEEHPVDSLFHAMDAPVIPEGQYEWEVDKHMRFKKTYDRAERMLEQRLLANNTGSRVFSVTLGSMFFPGYVRGTKDTKTKIAIADNAFVFGITNERYISRNSRIGLEMQFNIPPKSNSFQGTSITGGMGFINSVFSYTKLGLGGLYGSSLRKKLLEKAVALERNSLTEVHEVQLRNLYRKIMMEPRFYFQFGVGAVNTTLIRIKGNTNTGSFSTTDYSQKKLSLHAGFGVSSRINKRLLYDMSVKYLYSPNYSPSIGGLESYSGFKLQLGLGYVFGGGFAIRKKILREIKLKPM